MVRNIFRFFALVLGGLHVIAAIKSQSMNADGIAYLDIGDAYFHADWPNAINAVWSPLYSWILGLVNFIFEPAMQWEYPTVHIINFFIYVFALASFEFMWAKVRQVTPPTDTLNFSESTWWILGYLIFIWTSLSLIQIWSVTPDMLMAGFVYLAAGLMAQIRSGVEDYRFFLSLGLVLGLGYLSKTFMFSIAIVFLGLAGLVQIRSQKSIIKTLSAASVFLLVSLPFIFFISNARGKITIGEAGNVTYVRHVIGIPYPHWQGDWATGTFPLHPSRIIHESPRVYEFGEPIGGTYPISMDPSYWYEGIDVHVKVNDFSIALLASGKFYLDLFFQQQGILSACVCALFFLGKRSKLTLLDIIQNWALSIAALFALGLYGLVLVANRYIGVFIALFWVDILANIRLSDMPENKTWLRLLGGIAAAGLLMNIFLFNLGGFASFTPFTRAGFSIPAAPPARPLAVAQTLEGLGVKPGDKVGVIGYAYDSFWARLARVKIVAEMLEADAMDFWRGDKPVQLSVLQAFADAGASAVIAEYVPENASLPEWFRVGDTNFYIFLFAEE